MMRTESAARAKGNYCSGNVNLIPAEGSKRRALYDEFMAHKAEPILPESLKGYRLGQEISSLKDFYGLDIRVFYEIRHSIKGCAYKRYWLVGEWFGKTYIDYVATRREQEEREMAQ